MTPEPILTTGHPVAQCVDLRATFAGQFRFGWDEAYAVERPEFRRIEAPWLTIIRCQFGKIFPWGGRLLAAYTTTRRHRLATLPGVTVAQGGRVGRFDGPEVIVTFDVSQIAAVAELLVARRPRHMSPEQRARAVARLQQARETLTQRRRLELEATISGHPDPPGHPAGDRGVCAPKPAADGEPAPAASHNAVTGEVTRDA